MKTVCSLLLLLIKKSAGTNAKASERNIQVMKPQALSSLLLEHCAHLLSHSSLQILKQKEHYSQSTLCMKCVIIFVMRACAAPVRKQ